jgi:sortase A
MRIVRGIAGLLGELLVTLGVVLLLFVGWQLWWTDVVSDADASQVVAEMQQQFDDPGSDWVQPKQAKLGDAFAIVRIPRFGEKFARPLYEGTTREVLQRGVGHYVGTALPGELGNFAMAGHRTTYGKPFNRIAELRKGDVVLVETKDTWYVYRVSGHEIVPPSQVSVLLPVPNEPDAEPSEAVLTMTSCHPEFSARERYVVHATLQQQYPHAQGVPADVLEVAG